jgi:hypothetical protein
MARTNLPVSGLGSPLVPENSGPVGLVAAPLIASTATATTGGTVAAGTYLVAVSFVTPNGETICGPVAAQVTTGATSTLTVNSPTGAPLGPQAPNFSAYTGWYAYVSQVGGSTLTRQQVAGSPTAIGTNLVITAPPTSSGLNPLLWDPAGTAADQANGMNIAMTTTTIPPSYDAERGVLLRVNNSAANALNLIVRAGAYPPAMRQFLGDLLVNIPAGKTLWVGPLEMSRHAQSDDSINIDFQAAFTGTITAFVLPKNVG